MPCPGSRPRMSSPWVRNCTSAIIVLQSSVAWDFLCSRLEASIGLPKMSVNALYFRAGMTLGYASVAAGARTSGAERVVPQPIDQHFDRRRDRAPVRHDKVIGI